MASILRINAREVVDPTVDYPEIPVFPSPCPRCLFVEFSGIMAGEYFDQITDQDMNRRFFLTCGAAANYSSFVWPIEGLRCVLNMSSSSFDLKLYQAGIYSDLILYRCNKLNALWLDMENVYQVYAGNYAYGGQVRITSPYNHYGVIDNAQFP
jgi:hypothetical protein